MGGPASQLGMGARPAIPLPATQRIMSFFFLCRSQEGGFSRRWDWRSGVRDFSFAVSYTASPTSARATLVLPRGGVLTHQLPSKEVSLHISRNAAANNRDS